MTGVRSALAPDGRILISDHHPIWETLGVAGDRQLTVLNDYFEQHELPEIVDTTKAAIGKAETLDNETPLQSFIWGIGALVSVLLRHDFQILALLELPNPDMYRGLGEAADCVPAVYRLMAKHG